MVTAAKPQIGIVLGDLLRCERRGVLRTATQSMISGNRGNNGLGPVIIDADLMPLASEQARATAAGDGMGRAFQERMCNAGFGGSAAVENVGAGYYTLADAYSGWRGIRRSIAPTCSIGASPTWGSPRPMRRARSTRCSGH